MDFFLFELPKHCQCHLDVVLTPARNNQKNWEFALMRGRKAIFIIINQNMWKRHKTKISKSRADHSLPISYTFGKSLLCFQGKSVKKSLLIGLFKQILYPLEFWSTRRSKPIVISCAVSALKYKSGVGMIANKIKDDAITNGA